MNLSGTLITLRTATDGDTERFASILTEPEVARRWGPFDDADLDELVNGDDEVFAVEVDGEVIGAIQFSEEHDPMYRHASVDIFLSPARHRQGFGRPAIRSLPR